MLFINHTRRGNALFLTTIILALVVTGMMSLTDQLIGRKKLDDFSRMNTNAQDAADSVAETLCDRIRANSALLMTDLNTSQNGLGNWLTRGYVGSVSEVATAKGIWLNDCLVYWRLEPVASYDRTITDSNGNGSVDDADISAQGGSKYLINQALDVNANATVPTRGVGTANDNPGLLFFELTVDAFAMPTQNNMTANPLAVAANLSSANKADQSPLHAQSKKRVMVKEASLFRYVIFYNASGPSGDIELFQAPNISVVGAVHTNGAAYLGFNVGVGVFGSSPAVTDSDPTDSVPGLKPIAFTAVNGIFCMRKIDNYLAGLIDPTAISRTDSVNETPSKQSGLNPPYLNSVKLGYTSKTVGGSTLQLPGVTGTLQNPLTVARDSRRNAGGTPLSGYDTRLVRDAANRQMKKIDIASRLKMSGYRPLEPFALVGPGVKLLGINGSYSVVSGATTGNYATDMMLFQVSTSKQDVFPTQPGYSGDTPPAIAAGSLPTPNTTRVSAFNLTTIPLPAPAINPPAVSRVIYAPAPPAPQSPSGINISNDDIFSHIATYIQPTTPANSPVLNNYIRNPLGLNPRVTPGVGIVILERGKQAAIPRWPSGFFVISSGAVQSATTNTIVLNSGTASAVNGMYTSAKNGTALGCSIRVTDTAGTEQVRTITAYVGSTRTATLSSNWTTIPNNTYRYVINPSTQRLGKVSWDPPSVFSTSDATNSGAVGPRYYDSNNDGVIDPDVDVNGDGIIDPNAGTLNGQMTAFLMDYCQWMRSNYVVYFGVNSAGNLVDITDQFFSIPTGANKLSDLLACEDVFKDRRESRWRQSTVNQYADSGAANYDAVRVNALTLNTGAICNFIRTMTLNRLDPTTTSTSPASTRFNGTIYAARTARYSNPSAPAAGQLGMPSTSLTGLFTYRQYGEFHPLAPLGFSQLQTDLNTHKQRTSLPAVAKDTIPATGTLRYPVVGNMSKAMVNGYPAHSLVGFGSDPQVWSAYPFLKRVRIANAGTINWGGVRANGRAIGLTIYTPEVCYLQGNFNVVADTTGKFPVCALYCDGLVALSTAWTDAAVNALSGLATGTWTTATSTIHRLCLVIHNTPTDLANINVSDVSQPGGSGGIHNVIKFLENWSGIDWAFVGSLVVLNRGTYTRGYLGNQDIYNPPNRLYCFNDDLFRELPPFPDIINDVFIW
jgi:hypothetical protein